MRVEFYRHALGDEEKAAIEGVLDSVFLTTGQVTADFEAAFAAHLGVGHALGVMSCTHALGLALRSLDLEPGAEVITTPMTFAATSNAILHVGATPVFVDVDPITGLLDLDAVAAAITPRTRAVIPVHLYGVMVDMKRLRALADAHGLAIVEDAAHCIEGSRDGVRPGQLGDAAAFSFYATKNITCGEGGAVVTRDAARADWLRKARLHGVSKDAAARYGQAYNHWEMLFLGYKSNLTNLQASLLLPQLPKMAARLARREAICQRYEQAFADLDGVDFPRVPDGCTSARHLFTIWVDPARRDDTLARIQEQGVGVAVNYRAVHLLQYYREAHGFKRGMFPRAERIGDATLSLPLYPLLTDEQVEAVIAAVRAAVQS